jgi:chromosome segregation ATPase
MTKKSLSDLLREEATTASETSAETAETSNASVSRSRMTKAQLDNMITELTQDLDLCKKQVDDLQKQVKTLETEVKDEKDLSSRLQTQLKEAEDYQSQLNEQTKLVEKLYGQLQQKEELAIEIAKKNELILSLKAQLEPKQRTVSKPDSSPGLVVQKETVLTRQAKELEPFAAPASSRKPLTNEDIGWFD